LEHLEGEMKAASAELDFERAAKMRDELMQLRDLIDGKSGKPKTKSYPNVAQKIAKRRRREK
jgi:excinuclease UvrABC nuclease subunit